MLHRLAIVLTFTLGACAAHVATDTLPRTYDCGSAQVVASAGEHFQVGDAEYIAPVDRQADVIGSGARCVARGGYTDALTRFLRSGDERSVARDLGVEDTVAHHLIGEALHQAHHRYFQQ